MRLTIINQFYPPDLSPTAHLAASLAKHRAALGDDVTVITSNAGYVDSAQDRVPSTETGPNVEGHTNPPIRVVRLRVGGGGKSSLSNRLGGYGGFTLGAWWRLATLHRQDVIVAMTTPPYVVLAAFIHRLLHPRTKIILWSMDVYPDTAEVFGPLNRDSFLGKLLRKVNRWLYPRLDHLVVLDEAMGEVLLSQYGTPSTLGANTSSPPMTVIPNWEPLAANPLNPNTPIWSEYLTNQQLANQSVVAYLGNTGTGHSFDTVIQGAGRLAGQSVSFLFVGGGVRRPTLETAALAFGEGRGAPIVLYDYVSRENVPSILAGAMASLITLDDRAWGLMSPSKLHAALAAGVPIVYIGPTGTNVDEAIVNYGCGVSIRNGDVDSLVSTLVRLRDDEQYRNKLAKAARDAFETSYCDTATLPAFDTIIAQVTARSTP